MLTQNYENILHVATHFVVTRKKLSTFTVDNLYFTVENNVDNILLVCKDISFGLQR